MSGAHAWPTVEAALALGGIAGRYSSPCILPQHPDARHRGVKALLAPDARIQHFGTIGASDGQGVSKAAFCTIGAPTTPPCASWPTPRIRDNPFLLKQVLHKVPFPKHNYLIIEL